MFCGKLRYDEDLLFIYVVVLLPRPSKRGNHNVCLVLPLLTFCHSQTDIKRTRSSSVNLSASNSCIVTMVFSRLLARAISPSAKVHGACRGGLRPFYSQFTSPKPYLGPSRLSLTPFRPLTGVSKSQVKVLLVLYDVSRYAHP